MSEPLDKNGKAFDPEIHLSNVDGTPVTTKAGTIRLKPGPQKGADYSDNPLKKYKRVNNQEDLRSKIKASALINSLNNHVLGKKELSQTQIRAVEILLNRVMPTLQSQEIKQEVTEKKVVSAEPMALDAWEAQASTPESAVSHSKPQELKEDTAYQDQPNVSEIASYKH